MHKLKKVIAEEDGLNQIISDFTGDETSEREKCVVLALTGWRCVELEAEEED